MSTTTATPKKARKRRVVKNPTVKRSTGATGELQALLKKGCSAEQYAEAAGVELETARIRLREGLASKDLVKYLPPLTKEEQTTRTRARLLSVGGASKKRRAPYYKFA